VPQELFVSTPCATPAHPSPSTAVAGLRPVQADDDRGLDLDVTYVRRRSLALDLWILMNTVPAVLSRRATR
jgi:lipopolysaccharide/colanic/teichoic acid biosynthesis glycosyltransferase